LITHDGITEWRDIWENPKYASGGGFTNRHLNHADKIGCHGRQQVRQFEFWGLGGKTELVGLPRFDEYLAKPKFINDQGKTPKKIIVMTANTPGHTKKQIDDVKRGLKDINSYFSQNKQWEVIWRVKKGLDVELGLDDNYPELRDKSLSEVLCHIDAAITTPSTTMIECMLLGVPTAIMDYSNSPHYVTAAWKITAPDHLKDVADGLWNPPVNRVMLQDEILHDSLECYTPAAPRMIKLIETMIFLGEQAKTNGHQLSFPGRILPVEFGGFLLPSEYYDLTKLYPDHPTFANSDRTELQRQLLCAQMEILELRTKLESQRVGYWVNKIFSNLLKRMYT
jgi:hypothetical protein